MKMRLILLLILSVVVQVTRAQTAANCPWLAPGSAAIALGGDVTVTALSENNWQGACHFERQTTGVRRTIDIRVSDANSHSCPTGSTELPALGNEAVQCSRAENGEHVDTIAGRVRNAWFEVSITGVPYAARVLPSGGEPNRASLLERLAEQVAGNLF